MENWEFFLQKVGTENWLRVESPQAEFPNGRYRIAARVAHRPQEWIEVEVSLHSGERICQRSCQLDQAGFGILIPEIELTPGLWNLHCQGDILSELMGANWAVHLSLRVTLNLESAAIHFPSQAPSADLGETNPDADLSELRSRLLDDADQILEEIVDDLFPTFHPSCLLKSPPSSSEYSLHLDEEILVAETSKPIILSGEITTQQSPPHPQLRLQISLRDPRTGETVAQLFPRLREQSFPLTFCYSLSVPSPCDSYLLEGEIVLSEVTPQADQEILSRQAFTVSANWKKLEPIVEGAMCQARGSHLPAPLSPLSSPAKPNSPTASSRWQGIFPPKLSTTRKKKTPPKLPNLPNTISKSSKPTATKEYVWSKPETEASPFGEWELIPELVIVANDETES